MPDGLRQRLREVALDDEVGLDEQLRNVAVPSGLAQRLRLSVAEDDAGLDRLLRDVPVPYRLIGDLGSVAGYRLQLKRISGWVVAATLMIAIGLSYFGAVVGILVASRPVASDPAMELPAYVSGELLPGDSESSFGAVQIDLPPGSGQGDMRPVVEQPSELPRPPQLVGHLPPLPWGLPEEFTLFRRPGGLDPLLDTTPYRWGVFGSHEALEEPRGWQEARALRARGIPAPDSLAFDFGTLVRFGVFPFIPTAADESLRSVSVPLNVGTDSFELTRRSVMQDRLPPPDQIHTEEFLGAIDYDFPKPNGRALRLSLSGAANPFVPAVFVLQGGVQAVELAPGRRRPVHLILTIDASSGNRQERRLSMLRRAVADVCRRFGPDDRISLVAFHQGVEVLAERAGPDHAEQLHEALGRLATRGASNPGAGLGAAYALARPSDDAEPDAQPLVVLLTDGITDLPMSAAARIERHLSEAVAEGVKLHVIAPRAAGESLNVQLQSLATAGGGRLWHADDGRQLSWVLREAVTGQTQLVAEEARLTVRFDPKAVRHYRLIGHEPGARTMESASVLHSGQSSTVLFDVQLAEDLKPNDVLARAELTWRDPGGGLRGRETAVIRRRDLAAALVEAPLPLQAAVVVAETGEVLRRSVYAQLRPRPGSLEGVAALLEQLDSELWYEPSFKEFIEVLQRAVKARPHRGSGANRP